MKDTWPCGTPRSRNNALDWRRSDAAITALREALSAPEPEPVALESVHLTRDTKGMCVVRVNGRVAIRDNGDIIDHMATLEWFAAPAQPAVRHVRKVGGSFQHTGTVVAEFRTAAGEPRIVLEFDAPVTGMLHVYRPDQVEPCEPVAPAAPPAAPAPAMREPLTDEQLARIAVEDEFLLYCDQDSFNEIARAIEAAHGITGGKP